MEPNGPKMLNRTQIPKSAKSCPGQKKNIQDGEFIYLDNSIEALEILRHSTAHLMAQAIKDIYNEAQFFVGPIVDEGFYYDFSRKEPFTKEDLARIENRMKEIVDRNEITKKKIWARSKAISHFKEKGEILHTITLKSDDTFYNTLEEMVKSLHTTKSDLIRKAVVYYKDALEKERLKEQIKNASFRVREESLKIYNEFESTLNDGL